MGSKSCMLKSDARQEKLKLIMSSLVESQQNAPVANDSKSLVKQLLCSFIINLVGLLQGASVSTSSIILHSLHQSERRHGSCQCLSGTSGIRRGRKLDCQQLGSWP